MKMVINFLMKFFTYTYCFHFWKEDLNMALTDGLSAADLAAVLGNNNGNDFGGNSGAWWLLILLIFANNGWGNNGFGGGNGYMPPYATASDV
jgi:hypothetical protein